MGEARAGQPVPKFKLCPIDRLPPELVAKIFEHYILLNQCSPVLVSHVSSVWRRTAITTPTLWRTLSTQLPAPAPESDRVHAWLTRSGSVPLRLALAVTDWTDDPAFHSTLAALHAHASHWHHFALTASSYHIARRVCVFLSPSPHQQRTLARIDLTVGTLEDIFAEDPLQQGPPDDVLEARSDLALALYSIHASATHLTELNLAASTLPHAASLPTLRTLRIFEHDGHFAQIGASAVLGMLAKCPALQHFTFKGWYSFEPLAARPVADVVHLPYLRELHLAQTFHQGAILSRLRTPALETLRLSWLNRPDHLIDEAYVEDDDDDDDDDDEAEEEQEPVEFSQSPDTDVLTGTGLRTLVRRSTPPLRVLDMDFADARSPRDFVWLFARLPTLEAFRIVGSDMSDKVLYALARRRGGQGWLCPRLRCLEFSRCDMITGRSVVVLAQARNPAREVGAEGEGECAPPARLDKFIVEACGAVDCESIAVKQNLLGDISFEVETIPLFYEFPDECMQMPA